ncbi:hypothetical protein GGS20DRAFT_593346 [Poronia punctata]|nr:hypothetical protein GGS20DRAFT_593346 [Poronia punctata]
MTSNYFQRVVPDLSRLVPESGNRAMDSQNNFTYTNAERSQSISAGNGGTVVPNYEDSDLNAIMRSQMNQDLIAYRYDLEFCQTQLNTQGDLSPQEIRTLQIRILDCGHNIRHCKHRIQTIDAQTRLGLNPYGNLVNNSGASTGPYGNTAMSAPTRKYKRQRVRRSEGDDDDAGNGGDAVNGDGETYADTGVGVDVDADADGSVVAARTESPPGTPSNQLQRLGYWDCRLCRSRKYLEAGQNRVPSAPAKWPLKDISKLINHYLDLHTEHSPQERCSELGDALARNRGPFQYWLTRTRGKDHEAIDEYIHALQHGQLPDAMRELQPAARNFPNTVSSAYKK